MRIAKQRQRVAAWEILAIPDDDSTPDAMAHLDGILDRGGLTDACRTVLRGSSKEWMTTADIQTGLRELGFDLKKYKAPHASIMTTVNRLTEGDESEVMVKRSSNPGATEYKWVGPSYAAATGVSIAQFAAIHAEHAKQLKEARESVVAATEKMNRELLEATDVIRPRRLGVRD